MDQQPIRNVIFTYLIEKGIKEFQVALKGNRLYRTMAEDNSSSTAWVLNHKETIQSNIIVQQEHERKKIT